MQALIVPIETEQSPTVAIATSHSLKFGDAIVTDQFENVLQRD